ncbi:MAG: LuxR C-terminal-related transcriptional regulator [Myxococcales bacterium]|nr:LuxR C-terminal-related transcriptional regulator [Myxococcales bacterium]
MRHSEKSSNTRVLLYDPARFLSAMCSELELKTRSTIRLVVQSEELFSCLRNENFDVIVVRPSEDSNRALLPEIRDLARFHRFLLVSRTCSAETAIRIARSRGLFLPASAHCHELAEAIMWLTQPKLDALSSFVRKYRLSPQETHLIRCAYDRLTTEQAAKALGCRRATISTYWNRIFRKTGVCSQRDAMVLLLHSVEPPDPNVTKLHPAGPKPTVAAEITAPATSPAAGPTNAPTAARAEDPHHHPLIRSSSEQPKRRPVPWMESAPRSAGSSCSETHP